MEGLIEALTLARRAGVPDARFFQALASNAGYSGLVKLKEQKLRAGDFSPQFSVKHMLKDMRLAAGMPAGRGLPGLEVLCGSLAAWREERPGRGGLLGPGQAACTLKAGRSGSGSGRCAYRDATAAGAPCLPKYFWRTADATLDDRCRRRTSRRGCLPAPRPPWRSSGFLSARNRRTRRCRCILCRPPGRLWRCPSFPLSGRRGRPAQAPW